MRHSTTLAIEKALRETAEDVRRIKDAAAKAAPIGPGTHMPKTADGLPGMSEGWQAEKLVGALSRQGLFIVDETALREACRAVATSSEWLDIAGLHYVENDLIAADEHGDPDALVRAIVSEIRP